MQSDALKRIVRATVPRTIRNWLRSPSKSAAWLWDATSFSLGMTKKLSLSPEWTVVCHPHFYKVVHGAQIVDPEQAEEFRNFSRHCAKGMVLFDIGAHFGIFSLAAAHFGGRAVAVDPSPTATKMIATEAALNGVAKDIKILQAAVSDCAGPVGMLSSGVFSDGYFKFARGRAHSDLTQTQAFTVDQLAGQFGLPTHIKIDVEGHEAAVLRGSRSTLRAASPTVFLEIHNEIVAAEGLDPDSTLDELDEVGYAAFGLDASPISREEILCRPIIRIVASRKGA
jgi:FkbM family methyltransferase